MVFLQAHAACYVIVPPVCDLGRLASVLLSPTCVQLSSRNFSKMHCYRISESCQNELGNACGHTPDTPSHTHTRECTN